jgi:uncharacterized protein (DUF952 family)
MELIYKVVPTALWREAQETGAFNGTPADRTDGFLHFSTAGQIHETAEKFFAGQGGLVLVTADKDRLGEALRFEPSRGGALFTHLYGPLPVEAAVLGQNASAVGRWPA